MFRLVSATSLMVYLLIIAAACQPSPPSTASLEVQDQDITDNIVTIPHVVIDKTGWLIFLKETAQRERHSQATAIALSLPLTCAVTTAVTPG